MLPYRIGTGYDIHRLVEGLDLVLGGVKIPHNKGLEGHSDADCLLHAIADSILGATGLSDIGHYFPNTDPKIKGMDSMEILKIAVEEAEKKGYVVINIDSVIIAEEPKIAPYIKLMKEEISKTLKVSTDCIGIKATTNETIGDIGRGAGIAAQAVCLIEHVKYL